MEESARGIFVDADDCGEGDAEGWGDWGDWGDLDWFAVYARGDITRVPSSPQLLLPWVQ